MRSRKIGIEAILVLSSVVLVGCRCSGGGVVGEVERGRELPTQQQARPDPIEYWDDVRAGTNFFNEAPTRERFEAAATYGIDFVRLLPNNWSTESRDFLIGDADNYQGLVVEDLAMVRQVLNWGSASGMPVVLSTVTLPGARWRQHNNDRNDTRLWSEPVYQEQAARFWRELALELKDNPALVGYNLINEPPIGDKQAVREVSARLVSAIRSVDPLIPIMVDGADWASPEGLSDSQPLDDDRILYAVHAYLPWENTTWRINQGRVAFGSDDWNRQSLELALSPVIQWQGTYGVPSERVVVAEFGCDRRVPGVGGYLQAVINICEDNGWHWAFYSFRQDGWPAMDYELWPNPRLLVDEAGRSVNAVFRVLLDGIETAHGGNSVSGTP